MLYAFVSAVFIVCGLLGLSIDVEGLLRPINWKKASPQSLCFKCLVLRMY